MIQPMDIKTQSFKKGLFGYKSSDVDSFVDTVYRAYDEIFKENAELSDNLEKLNASLQESRLKIFELENQVKDSGSASEVDTEAAQKKADAIIKNAEKAAAEIISKAKAESAKLESAAKAAAAKVEEEPKKEAPKSTFSFADEKEEPAKEPVKESASSKFFSSIDDDAPIGNGDDDEIFVGEIEEARKPDRMMIGDGEEEESMDFEFL